MGACKSEVLSPLVGDNDSVRSLRFYREFNDWELAASYSFFHFIQTWIPRGGGCDRLCWHLSGSGKFDIRSFYHKIRNVTLSTFLWKGIWKVKVLKRVAFCMWTATYGQILTLDNLILRGRPLANHCCMCCSNEESLVDFLSGSSFLVDIYASIVWDSLGHARFSCRLIILLVSLA